uniref:Uncharacterized protein n=1 Tax=Ananas comosus var. bracteatus TaxID=296719 RepID=A0A6V7NFM3_ANACO|nr:unnamed protein product [Ananas comosus var. bracteatus]
MANASVDSGAGISKFRLRLGKWKRPATAGKTQAVFRQGQDEEACQGGVHLQPHEGQGGHPGRVPGTSPGAHRQDSSFPDQSLFPEADGDRGREVPSQPDTTTTFHSNATPESSYAGGNPNVVELCGHRHADASPFDAFHSAF